MAAYRGRGRPPKAENSATGMEESNTESWNSANLFVQFKIMKPILELDTLERIALFGSERMDEFVPPEQIPLRRFEALTRFYYTLLMLIGNAKFRFSKNDISLTNFFKERLENVKQVFGGCMIQETNTVTHQTENKINDELFMKAFNTLKAIKDDLLHPLDRTGMIFRASEEEDLSSIMSEIINEGS